MLLRHDYQCVACGRVAFGRDMHADHISPVVVGTDCCEDGRSRFDVNGGQALCVSCHARKTLAEARGGRFGS